MQSVHDASKKWNERYKKLKAFKETHGHTRVPQRYGADKSLGLWVSRQRKLYNKEELRTDRKRLLNKIGFDWQPPKTTDPNDLQWMEKYEQLKAYKEIHGNTRVPRSYGADRSLAEWVNTQRTCFKKGTLRDGRRRLLNEIEFVWSKKVDHEKFWLTQYEKLKAYKETHGNTRVPRRYGADRTLGEWVINQRRFRKEGTLREDRKMQLNRIGFEWEPPTGVAAQQGKKDAQWLQKYEKVKEFKRTHGHIRIPKTPHRELSRWISKQRFTFRKGTLREDRRQLLEAIAFPFEPRGSGAATRPADEVSVAESDQGSFDGVLDDAVVDDESDEEELDEGSEEDKKPPPVIDLSCASRRSKRLSGQKRGISYNEDSSDDEDLDPADKKFKVEKEQVVTVKEDGDAPSHTERAIKEEEDAPPIKHETQVVDDYSTGIVIKEEENEFIGPVKKEEEDEESMDVKLGAMKKEEEEEHHNAIKKEDENEAPGGPNGKRIKEEKDGKIAIKHVNIMKKTET